MLPLIVHNWLESPIPTWQCLLAWKSSSFWYKKLVSLAKQLCWSIFLEAHFGTSYRNILVMIVFKNSGTSLESKNRKTINLYARVTSKDTQIPWVTAIFTFGGIFRFKAIYPCLSLAIDCLEFFIHSWNASFSSNQKCVFIRWKTFLKFN